MRKKHWTVTPLFFIFGVVMLFMAIASHSYNQILCYIEMGISIISLAVVAVLLLRFRSYVSYVVRSIADKINGIDSSFLEKYKYPIAIVGTKGDILWCNVRFRKQMSNAKNPEGDNISAYLSGFDFENFVVGEGIDIAHDGKEYTVYCTNTENGYICHFIDNTYYKAMVREYNTSLPCVALITFDNVDDFSNSSDEDFSQATLSVETYLQKWANLYNALYKKISTNRYMIIFRETDVEKMVALKFPILKEIHEIAIRQNTATISVGLCRGAKTLKESELSARKALEMALGRGGDQVAIIKNNSYDFFGGTAAASEKLSKVRMRVIANAISRAVADCDKVLLMGHRFSDLDCVGAAIGMQCIMEKSFKRYSRIVIDKENSMAQQLITYAENRLDNNIFISVEDAIKNITPKTLLIILDTHLKTSLESAQIYEKCKRVIVIDHHRKAVNYIDNALVFCHEPSASSSSEMCSEIISCLDDASIGYVQADALLAGIMLDTKNFVIKTGVRTFEAAAYLRKKGANTLTVKEMFSDSIETYKEKVDIVCKANIYKNCAFSVASQKGEGIRLAAAQAADEMLSLQGVDASFVLFEGEGRINISARSYGRINVQIIMEKLGGGGHQTMAAAQLYDITMELAYQKLMSVIDEVLDDVSA
ncbi:MAG: DHH family phosphoesterase [Ruminococcus sp.]|nr:DHH family phosphoesterase [Ruminococcus sp.]